MKRNERRSDELLSPGGRLARMEDVARLAGVSLITVSRMLREPGRVAESTRSRIAEAIAATGYVPNLVAGSLKSSRTGMIACVVPSVEHSFVADVIRGASDVLRPLGFHVLLATSDFSSGEEEDLVRTFLSRRPDAMILTGQTHTAQTRRMLLAARIPVVEVGSLSDRAIDRVVGYSNVEASRMITAALVARGCRRIGYLLHRGVEENDRARDRLAGYQTALREAGLGAGPVVQVDFSYGGGAQGLARALVEEPATDGLCCSNDVIAIGALFECQRRGLQVPSEMALAGFDDQEISSSVTPELSSVRIPRAEMGRRAGELIRRLLGGEREVPAREDVGFELRLRQTT
jgi:LacI family transcriptional regulator, gluconate utilization system Gnt-I transcriptional repressor